LFISNSYAVCVAGQVRVCLLLFLNSNYFISCIPGTSIILQKHFFNFKGHHLEYKFPLLMSTKYNFTACMMYLDGHSSNDRLIAIAHSISTTPLRGGLNVWCFGWRDAEMCPMQFIFLHAWVRAAPTAPIQGLMKNNITYATGWVWTPNNNSIRVASIAGVILLFQQLTRTRGASGKNFLKTAFGGKLS